MDGSIMKKGMHYDKLYSPMAGCPYIRIILIQVVPEVWKTMQVDYVQAFVQATIDNYLYLKVPEGFQVEDGDNYDYSIKAHRNIYGQK